MHNYYLAMPVTKLGKEALKPYGQSTIHPGGVEFSVEGVSFSTLRCLESAEIAETGIDFTLTLMEIEDTKTDWSSHPGRETF